MEAELWLRERNPPTLHLLLWEIKSSITRVSKYARYPGRIPQHNMRPPSTFETQDTE